MDRLAHQHVHEASLCECAGHRYSGMFDKHFRLTVNDQSCRTSLGSKFSRTTLSNNYASTMSTRSYSRSSSSSLSRRSRRSTSASRSSGRQSSTSTIRLSAISSRRGARQASSLLSMTPAPLRMLTLPPRTTASCSARQLCPTILTSKRVERSSSFVTTPET